MAEVDHVETIAALERRLAQLDSERARVWDELGAARRRAVTESGDAVVVPLGTRVSTTAPVAPAEKVSLFLTLFRCRESVYPHRWENKRTEKAGYSPACNNEWVPGVCDKPRIKCSACTNQAFPKLDALAADKHLRGGDVIGTYAIREDETCAFIACDFDGDGWRDDVRAYSSVARELGIDVAVERSRSGNGAHAWVFFSDRVQARMARALGTLILARASERRLSLSLDSYDRLFPNQDYVPRGGFGNLIALPLQRAAREAGNSVFVDEQFEPHADQWEFLSRIRRLSLGDLRTLLDKFIPAQGSQAAMVDDPSLETDQKLLDATSTADIVRFEGAFVLVLGSQISVPLRDLPGRLVAQLKRVASFANPEFYQLQRMRMPTYPHRRFLFSGEVRPDVMLLPRGVLDRIVAILERAGASVTIQDQRPKKKRLKVTFAAELRPEQVTAVAETKKHAFGVLVAPPGAGKTVMGCALIAERKVPTLVLVHRQQLLDQWKDSIAKFLVVDAKDVGTIAGAKKKPSGKIDLCTIQTLVRAEDPGQIVAGYGQVIVDECHHIPATSFEALMKQVPARFVVGLTATAYRKDGLQQILFHQCGPVRHEMTSVDGAQLKKRVSVRATRFIQPEGAGPRPPYHLVMEHLVTDAERNALIRDDILAAVEARRFTLVISDRKDHLRKLSELVLAGSAAAAPDILHLDGDLSAKERRSIIARVEQKRAERASVVLFATASLVGEGFDLPTLDTLVLATPLSFKGRMVQYAGRLHRRADGKAEVRIHDYVDASNAMTLKMYRQRVKAYLSMGYEVDAPSDLFARVTPQRSLFPRT